MYIEVSIVVTIPDIIARNEKFKQCRKFERI